MLMWAYPTEFTDPKVAGQVVDSTRNRFIRPRGISELFVLTQGYAVFDGFAAPIVGENGAEPNDTYVEPLVADTKAATKRRMSARSGHTASAARRSPAGFAS